MDIYDGTEDDAIFEQSLTMKPHSKEVIEDLCSEISIGVDGRL